MRILQYLDRTASGCATGSVVNKHGRTSQICWYVGHIQRIKDGSLTRQALVFNNSYFELTEVASHNEAVRLSHRDKPIDCGENIKLYRRSMALKFLLGKWLTWCTVDDQRDRDGLELARLVRDRQMRPFVTRHSKDLGEWVAFIKAKSVQASGGLQDVVANIKAGPVQVSKDLQDEVAKVKGGPAEVSSGSQDEAGKQ